MAKVKSISGIKYMVVTHVLVMLQWDDSNTRLRYTLHALPKRNKKISAGVDACVFWGILIICSAMLSWGSADIEVHSSMDFDISGEREGLLLLPTFLLGTPLTKHDQIQPRYVTPRFKLLSVWSTYIVIFNVAFLVTHSLDHHQCLLRALIIGQ